MMCRLGGVVHGGCRGMHQVGPIIHDLGLLDGLKKERVLRWDQEIRIIG